MHKTRNQIILALVINILLPYLAYTVLQPHTSNLTALSVAAVIPLLDTLYSLIRERKFDAFSGFIFLGLILGIIAVLLGGDERFILLRESYVTGILGIVFLGSLLARRPLIFHFADRFMGRDAQMNEKWQQLPGFRRSFRLITCVWGLVLALEACVKVPLVYSLSVPTFLVVSPIFTYGVIGLTILWNIRYVKRVKSGAASGPKPIIPAGR
jgi:intracellular septation protein A